MHVSREWKWGRERSARRIQLYKKRLVYAAHRGCGSALVVQVAYLIFIRSLFEYSVSFPPLSSLLSISFSIFAYFASLLLLALLFRQLSFDKAAKLLNTYLLLLPTKTAKKKELCQQVALIARVSLLPAGCQHHSPTPTCPVPPYPALLCRYTWCVAHCTDYVASCRRHRRAAITFSTRWTSTLSATRLHLMIDKGGVHDANRPFRGNPIALSGAWLEFQQDMAKSRNSIKLYGLFVVEWRGS